MSIDTLPAVVGTVAAALTLIAGGIAGVHYGIGRTLRDANKDLRDSLNDQEQRIAVLERDLAEEKAAHAATRSDLDAVRRTVTGEVHWEAISTQLDAHHKAARAAWQDTLDRTTLILDLLREGKAAS